MLAGLIFATQDAEDRPDRLVATLPFGGATLIEYQARLLVSVGVSQIVVAAERVTPELLGAVNRIGRRGVSADIVRTAREAAEKIHPLARIIVLADGLITTESILARIAGSGEDALLAVDEEHATPMLERIDADSLWAGVADIGPRRLADAARLPEDYDFQSTLLRVIAQSGATRLMLPADATAAHGIEHNALALDARGRSVLARLASRRPSWFDRLVIAPIARLALPSLVARAVPSGAAAGVGGMLALASAALLAIQWPITGLALGSIGIAVFAITKVLCWLRGQRRGARYLDLATALTAAADILLLGRVESLDRATATGWACAIAAVVALALGERAADDDGRRLWWGSPAAYPLLLLPFAIAGKALIGLALVAVYASGTLSAAIEALRREP